MADLPSPFRRWAFLDRDGTIIPDKVYLSNPADVEFAPGAVEGLRLLRDAGFGFVMITNQSGIGRGYFTNDDFVAVQARLTALLAAEGLVLAATYHCPHAPSDDCACRKPRPGMLRAAMTRFGIAPDHVVMIGDSDADIGAARAAGIAGIRIRQGAAKGATKSEAEGEAEGTVSDFRTAARLAAVMLSAT